MKKVTFFAVMLMVALAVTSCGSKEAKADANGVDSTQVDSVAVDSVAVDSVAVDSVK